MPERARERWQQAPVSLCLFETHPQGLEKLFRMLIKSSWVLKRIAAQNLMRAGGLSLAQALDPCDRRQRGQRGAT